MLTSRCLGSFRTAYWALHSSSDAEPYTLGLLTLASHRTGKKPSSSDAIAFMTAYSPDHRRMGDDRMLTVIAQHYLMSIEELLQKIVTSYSTGSCKLDLFALARIMQLPGYHSLKYPFRQTLAQGRRRFVRTSTGRIVKMMPNRVYGHLSGQPTFTFSYRDFTGVYEAIKKKSITAVWTTSNGLEIPSRQKGLQGNVCWQMGKLQFA
jgi:hypothetical protein